MRREKAVMLTSCLLVLTALTAAGVALRSMRSIRSPEEKEEEQIVDFSILEDESGEADSCPLRSKSTSALAVISAARSTPSTT